MTTSQELIAELGMSFFFWSGVIAWGLCGLVGITWFADFFIDYVIRSLWTKREFLAFVATRLKSRATSQSGE